MDSDQPLPDAARQMLARFGTKIEYTERDPHGIVNLAKSEVTNDDLRDLVFFPGFGALNLDRTLISDAGTKYIGQMGSLESVRLKDTLVSDDGLKSLQGLTKLERLNIGCVPGCFSPGKRPVPPAMVRRNRITNTGLGYLTELLALRDLNLQATHVSDVGLLRHIREMPKLQELSLAYLDLTDEALVALDSLEWLERINLRHTAVSNNAIVDFVNAKAHSLRQLNLSNTVVNDSALADFPERSQLQELSLSDTGITDAGCEHIVRCLWLTEIRLDLSDVTDDGVRVLSNCESLLNLELYKTKVTDAGLVWFSDSKIEYLGLGGTLLTDAGMPVLTDLSALHGLDLRATALTDKGLRFLSQTKGLEQLYLEYTAISNAGLVFLLHLPLESLSLNLAIEDAGLQTISHHQSLRRLAIWNAKVTSWQPLAQLDRLEVLLIDDSIADLSPLQTLHTLKVLLLWGDSFSPTELAKLRLSLPECQIETYERHERADDEFRNLCRYG